MSVRISEPLQRIDGFGASTFGGFELLERGNCDDVIPLGTRYHTSTEQRAAIIRTVVHELGLSHARIWVWGGIEPVNDNDDPSVMNMGAMDFRGGFGRPPSANAMENRQNGIDEWPDILKPAIAAGLVNWIVTPGELPVWLKRRINDAKDEQRFDEYAEWAAAVLLHLKQMGLEAPYWSMFNEPDVCGWTDDSFWRAWIRSTGRRFKREGLKTRIMFPDYMDVYRAPGLVEAVMKDAELRSYVGALAYHHYRSSGDGPQPFLKLARSGALDQETRLYHKIIDGAASMTSLGRRYGIPSWQMETAYYPRNVANLSEWEIGRGRANEIYYELTSGACAVEAMLAFWVDAVDQRYHTTMRYEGHYVVMRTDGTNVIGWNVTKDTGAVLGHYGRFVRPGDHRVNVDCEEPLLHATAFVSDTSKRIVLVVVNNAERSMPVDVDIAGLPPSLTYSQALLTDETHLLSKFGSAFQEQTSTHTNVTFPALSLTTLVWSREPLPAYLSSAGLGRPVPTSSSAASHPAQR